MNTRETLSFRIEPELREALRELAEQDHRPMASMVRIAVLEMVERRRKKRRTQPVAAEPS